jgi:signal peptidase I
LRDPVPNDDRTRILDALHVRSATLLASALIVALAATSCGANGSGVRRSGFDRSTKARPDEPAYRELSQAMEPTLSIGTRVIAVAAAPAIGNIVVLHPPVGAFREVCGEKRHHLMRGGSACDTSNSREVDFDMVSRVVAGPGDEIYVRDGHVYRKARGGNGFSRESDSYTRSCGDGVACDLPVPVTIAPGHWFVMGDNRGAASDSRSWGPVPTHSIIGVVTSLECRKFAGHRISLVRRSWQQGCRGVYR